MKIFVGNLPWDTSEPELREHFEQCGGVIEVSIRRDANGMPSFGFVTFKREDDARAAIAQLSGAVLDGRALNVAPAHRQT